MSALILKQLGLTKDAVQRQLSNPILKRLGLTPAMIARHVVSIEPPIRTWTNKTRAARREAGLPQRGEKQPEMKL